MAANLVGLVERLELAVNKIEGLVGYSSHHEEVKAAPVESKPRVEALPGFVVDYQNNVLARLTQLSQNAQAVDPQIVEVTNEIVKGMRFIEQVLIATSKCKKPNDQEQQQEITAKLLEIFKKLADFKNIRNNFTNHSTAAYEIGQALQWPVSPMPGPIIDNFLDAGAFYGNKILMAKIETHSAWYKLLREIIITVRDYVKENFASGLNWNPNGISIGQFFQGQVTEPTQAPVVKEEVKAPVEEVKIQAPAQRAVKKPGKFERGISWIIENYKDNRELEISEEESGLKKAIMLDSLENCIVQIKGKVKSIIISQCKRTSVVCQGIVSGVEIVNSTKTQVQSTGIIPSVSIDNSEGAQLFLSEGLQDVIITTSKSSDMTVTIPDPQNPDEWVERAIPHQFVHKILNGKITSGVSDAYGH